jgi:hypothetical protein
MICPSSNLFYASQIWSNQFLVELLFKLIRSHVHVCTSHLSYQKIITEIELNYVVASWLAACCAI